MTSTAAALVAGASSGPSAGLWPGVCAPGSVVFLLAQTGSRVQYAQGLD
jgi:hypothetical protein